MKIVKNPCLNCTGRHGYCHCEGQCIKGNAYAEFVEYREYINKQRYLKNLRPARKIKVSPSKRCGNI
jgi:hypothetical protein